MTDPIKLKDGEAGLFVRDRVCSRCYNDLTATPDEETRLWIISCPVCGDAWGYTTVSRNYAILLGQRAIADYKDLQASLPDLFPNPHKGKSKEQLLSELGY